jgi:hypothetical protein
VDSAIDAVPDVGWSLMSRRNRQPRRKPSPDDNLAKENYPGLNQTFYAMSPHAYLQRRLKSLLLWHGNPGGLDAVLSTEFVVEGITVGLGAEDDEEAKRQRDRFVVLEAEVLLHHVSETLLRLYLVHSTESPCPWLDISRERNFAVFKKEVGKLRDRLGSGSERGRIEKTFFGTEHRDKLPIQVDEEDWDAASKNIADYLNFFAGHFLDSAPYNAAKHGLALLAGPAGFQLGAGEDTEPFLSRSGPALEYLSVERDETTGDPRWTHVTKWVMLRRAIAMTHLGCRLLEGIWGVGAWRRTGKRPEVIHLFNEPVFADVMRHTEREAETGIPGITTDRILEQLLYGPDEPDQQPDRS